MLQAKEEIDKVKSRALTETDTIKAEVESTIDLVKNIDQDYRRPIEILNNEVESLKRGIIDAPHLYQ